jgi:hypothetical protein
VAEIFPDLIGLRPWALITASYRDPMAWAKRRKEEHGMVSVCHRSLWNTSGVLHPYDYIGCLKTKSNVKDALVIAAKKLSIPEMASAYIKMNTVNAFLALSKGVSFLPICIFDSATGTSESIASLLTQNGMKPHPHLGGNKK